MPNRQKTKTITILLQLIFWSPLAVSASARKGVGISSWCAWNPKQVSRADCPELRCVPFVLGWNKLEPRPRQYEFDKYVGEPLRAAVDDDLDAIRWW